MNEKKSDKEFQAETKTNLIPFDIISFDNFERCYDSQPSVKLPNGNWSKKSWVTHVGARKEATTLSIMTFSIITF